MWLIQKGSITSSAQCFEINLSRPYQFWNMHQYGYRASLLRYFTFVDINLVDGALQSNRKAFGKREGMTCSKGPQVGTEPGALKGALPTCSAEVPHYDVYLMSTVLPHYGVYLMNTVLPHYDVYLMNTVLPCYDVYLMSTVLPCYGVYLMSTLLVLTAFADGLVAPVGTVPGLVAHLGHLDALPTATAELLWPAALGHWLGRPPGLGRMELCRVQSIIFTLHHT